MSRKLNPGTMHATPLVASPARVVQGRRTGFKVWINGIFLQISLASVAPKIHAFVEVTPPIALF